MDAPIELWDVADRLHSVSIHLLRRLRKVDEASGLSGPRLSALSVVVFGGPLTVTELAAAEQVKVPTMTRLVQALEHDGFVRRRADAADGRVSRLEATAKGKKVMMEGRARRVSMLVDLLAGLSTTERQEMHAVVTRLQTALVAKKA